MSKADGGCLCGAVRYTVDTDIDSSIICHCRSCRVASGSPSVGWITLPKSRFEVTKGQPSVYQSSEDVERGFCRRCGTPLTFWLKTDPESIDVTTATLDDPEPFPPTREVWISHKVSWESVDADRAMFDEGSGDVKKT